jgi:hypothetical protein
VVIIFDHNPVYAFKGFNIDFTGASSFSHQPDEVQNSFVVMCSLPLVAATSWPEAARLPFSARH